jgi:hypothetical protein
MAHQRPPGLAGRGKFDRLARFAHPSPQIIELIGQAGHDGQRLLVDLQAVAQVLEQRDGRDVDYGKELAVGAAGRPIISASIAMSATAGLTTGSGIAGGWGAAHSKAMLDRVGR